MSSPLDVYQSVTYTLSLMDGGLQGQSFDVIVDAGVHAAVVAEVFAGMLADVPGGEIYEERRILLKVNGASVNSTAVIPYDASLLVEATTVERRRIADVQDANITEWLRVLAVLKTEGSEGDIEWQSTDDFDEIIDLIVSLEQRSPEIVRNASLRDVLDKALTCDTVSPALKTAVIRQSLDRFHAVFVVHFATPPRIFINDLPEESFAGLIRERCAQFLGTPLSRVGLFYAGLELDYSQPISLAVRHSLHAADLNVQTDLRALPPELGFLQEFLDLLCRRWGSTSECDQVCRLVLGLFESTATRGDADDSYAELSKDVIDVLAVAFSTRGATAASVLQTCEEEFL